MGSVYAGLFASAGNDVLVVDAWREHVEAMRDKGLRVEGASGDRTVRVRAFERCPAERVDLLILATKAAQTAVAADDARALLGPDTVVLTIQNGLGSAEAVAEKVGADRLLVGIAAAFGASLRGPGHAHHNGMTVVRMGPHAGLPPERAQWAAQAWRDAGFAAEPVSDVLAMQWEKLICNVAYSGPCALTGLTIGQVMDDPDIGPVSRAAAVEALAVGRARGVAIAVEDAQAHVRAFGAKIPNARPSVLLDHDNRRPSEIDVINGAIPREAARCGLKAPVNATITALVKARERHFR
jgi:2-dehydropantoate 2-reductase